MDAQVVCRELGQPNAVHVTDHRSFGAGGGNIWFSDVNCQGSESELIRCPRGDDLCRDHSRDIGVVCTSKFQYANLMYSAFIHNIVH